MITSDQKKLQKAFEARTVILPFIPYHVRLNEETPDPVPHSITLVAANLRPWRSNVVAHFNDMVPTFGKGWKGAAGPVLVKHFRPCK